MPVCSRVPKAFSSVIQLCLTLWDPMDCSMPGFPVYHQFPEPTQTHLHYISDAIQPSHPLLSPSPPSFNLSQHQGLFQGVNSSHQVAKVLEFQLQHQSFRWIFRPDFPLRWTGRISLQSKGLSRVFSNTTVQKHQFFSAQGIRKQKRNLWIICPVVVCCACMLSCVWLFATPWTVAHQAPLSMEFSRQECWSGLPFPTPGDLSNPGIEPVSPVSSALVGRFFTTAPPGKPHNAEITGKQIRKNSDQMPVF